MVFRLILTLTFLMWGFSLKAQEDDPQYFFKDSIIFVGELTRKTITPDRSGVEINCTEEGEEACVVIVQADGACGWESAEFEVLENLKGAAEKKDLSLNTYLNAWCKSSVEVLLGETFVMALKRREKYNSEAEEEYFIRTLQIMQIDELERAVFIDAPFLLDVCGKILGIDCSLSLRTIDASELVDHDTNAKWWNDFYEEYFEKEIFMRGDDGEVYLTKVLDVNDLLTRLNQH